MNYHYHVLQTNTIIRAILTIALGAGVLLAATLVPQPTHADWRSLSGGFLPVFSTSPSYLISPDSRTVAFVADKDTDNVFELYAVPMTGTTPIKLNPPLVEDGDVHGFQFTPDGQYVIYTADQFKDDRFEMFRVPVGGGQAVKLNPTLVAEGSVGEFKIDADSRRVVYKADLVTDDVFELWSAPIMGVGTAKLSGTMLVASGDVSFFQIDRSSGRVAFNADREKDEGYELYSVPITGGSPLKLNPPIVTGGAELGISNFIVHPNSPGVVFHARVAGTPKKRLYLVSTAGNIAPIPLSFDPADNQVMLSFRFNPTGERVVYNLAYVRPGTSTDKGILYSAPIQGGDSTTLTDFPDANHGADSSYRFTADGQRVVYKFQKDAAAHPYLASAQHNGVRRPLYVPGASDPPLFNFDISPDGQWVWYQTDVGYPSKHLYTVSPGGGNAIDHGLTDPIGVGMLPDSSRILYTRFVSITAGTNELFSARVSGGDERNLSGLHGAGRVGSPQVSRDSKWIVFHVEVNGQHDLRVSDGNTAQPTTPTPTLSPSPSPTRPITPTVTPTPPPTPTAPTNYKVYAPLVVR